MQWFPWNIINCILRIFPEYRNINGKTVQHISPHSEIFCSLQYPDVPDMFSHLLSDLFRAVTMPV